MKRTLVCLALAVVCGAISNSSLVAQQSVPISTQPQSSPAPARVPAKVLVTLTRYVAEKKVSALPYELYVVCVSSGAEMTQLRAGMQVVVPPKGEYQFVGTSVDTRCNSSDDGRYRLYVSINDSSIFKPADADKTGELPSLRSYTLSNTLLLKDAQTLQFSVGTDKVTGEITKADVTLTVLK